MIAVLRLLTMLFVLCTLIGCPRAGIQGGVRTGGLTVRPAPDPLVGLEAYTDEDLLRLAQEALDVRLYERAYLLYRRYLDEFPGASRQRAVAFAAALAAEKAELLEPAIALYSSLLVDCPIGSTERVTLRFRLAECTVDAGQWAAGRQHVNWLLKRTDLEPFERFELRIRRAWIDASTDQSNRAVEELRRLVGLYRFDRARTLGAFQGGMATFYLGETHRLQAEAVTLLEVDDLEQVREDLNRKARHILDAQDAYLESIRIGCHDWIPRSGWRLGGLYEQFRIDILAAPFPADVQTPQDEEIYREILSEQTAILLIKARTVYRKVLDKASEVSMHDEWVIRIGEALHKIEVELLTSGLAADI